VEYIWKALLGEVFNDIQEFWGGAGGCRSANSLPLSEN
jgi:hypothetical protein